MSLIKRALPLAGYKSKSKIRHVVEHYAASSHCSPLELLFFLFFNLKVTTNDDYYRFGIVRGRIKQ